MSLCLACAEWAGRAPLCAPCVADLPPGPRWRLASGLLVGAAFSHHGPSRRLIHRLKYQGLVEAAPLLAVFMVPLLPSNASSVIPVSRARLRRARYGIDPAVELAGAIGRLAGLPVDRILVAPAWWPRHAVRSRASRLPPRFRATSAAGPGAVLIDDVATSGATLNAANDALGADFRHGVVATAPGRVKVPAPSQAGEVPWRRDRT